MTIGVEFCYQIMVWESRVGVKGQFCKAPRTNIQAPGKLQIPSSKVERSCVHMSGLRWRVSLVLFFGAWSLVLGSFPARSAVRRTDLKSRHYPHSSCFCADDLLLAEFAADEVLLFFLDLLKLHLLVRGQLQGDAGVAVGEVRQ